MKCIFKSNNCKLALYIIFEFIMEVNSIKNQQNLFSDNLTCTIQRTNVYKSTCFERISIQSKTQGLAAICILEWFLFK